jgi:hypothetical protein
MDNEKAFEKVCVQRKMSEILVSDNTTIFGMFSYRAFHEHQAHQNEPLDIIHRKSDLPSRLSSTQRPIKPPKHRPRQFLESPNLAMIRRRTSKVV